MQQGSIVRIGSDCPQTRDGKHHCEDHCRMCGYEAGVAELVAENEKLQAEVDVWKNKHRQLCRDNVTRIYDEAYQKTEAAEADE